MKKRYWIYILIALLALVLSIQNGFTIANFIDAGVIPAILIIVISESIIRNLKQNEKVRVAQRALDDQKIRAEEAVKYMNRTVHEENDRIEKEFANAAAKLEKENPSSRMTLTKEQIEQLLELEKTTDFRIPESIAKQIKEHKNG